jgi:cation:H+ antiporter
MTLLAVSFVLGAAAVVVAGVLLARAGDAIAARTRVGNLWVGAVLVAGATSLPELAASLAAVRIGACDLAVGNLFGSNGFRMALLLALDVDHPGPLFDALDPAHALSGPFAVVHMGLGAAALVCRAEGPLAMLEPGSLGILIGHLLALWFLYARSGAGG